MPDINRADEAGKRVDMFVSQLRNARYSDLVAQCEKLRTDRCWQKFDDWQRRTP